MTGRKEPALAKHPIRVRTSGIKANVGRVEATRNYQLQFSQKHTKCQQNPPRWADPPLRNPRLNSMLNQRARSWNARRPQGGGRASPWLGQRFRPPLRYLGHNPQMEENIYFNRQRTSEGSGEGWRARSGLGAHHRRWNGRFRVGAAGFNHSAAQRLQRPEQASSAQLPGRGRRGGWNYWLPLAMNERNAGARTRQKW